MSEPLIAPGQASSSQPLPFSDTEREDSRRSRVPGRATIYAELESGSQPIRRKLNTYQRAKEPLRQYVLIDENGGLSTIQKEKQVVAQAFGLSLRDLRILDPNLAQNYPSAILCRDRAMVLNLEHIKLIIGTNRVLVLQTSDQHMSPFVDELQRRLANHWNSMNNPLAEQPAAPYELTALEVALESVAKYMEGLEADLEQKTHVALDELANKVNTKNLKWVRGLKAQLNRLTTRVETLKEVLERYLEDDADMKEMYLSKKILLELMHDDNRSKAFGHGYHFTPGVKRGGGAREASHPLMERYMVAQQQNAAQRATSGIPGIPGALPGTGAQALHTTVHSHTHSHMHGTVTHARNPSHAGAPGTGSSGSLHVSHRSARVAHADPTILSRPNVDPTARPLGTTHNRAGTSSSPALGAVAEPPAMHEDSEHLSVEQESTGTLDGGKNSRPPSPTPLERTHGVAAEPSPHEIGHVNIVRFDDPDSPVPMDPMHDDPGLTFIPLSPNIHPKIQRELEAALGRDHHDAESAASHSSRSSLSRSSYRSEVEEMVEEVEELLETYFLLLDNTLNKLRQLSNMIEDTEDFISIQLDSNRNQLVAIDLITTMATFSVTVVGAVSSVFGMNLLNPWDKDLIGETNSIHAFKRVTLWSLVFAGMLFATTLSYVYHRKLVSFPWEHSSD